MKKIMEDEWLNGWDVTEESICIASGYEDEKGVFHIGFAFIDKEGEEAFK